MIAGWLATADHLSRSRPWLCGVCLVALVVSIVAQVEFL